MRFLCLPDLSRPPRAWGSGSWGSAELLLQRRRKTHCCSVVRRPGGSGRLATFIPPRGDWVVPATDWVFYALAARIFCPEIYQLDKPSSNSYLIIHNTSGTRISLLQNSALYRGKPNYGHTYMRSKSRILIYPTLLNQYFSGRRYCYRKLVIRHFGHQDWRSLGETKTQPKLPRLMFYTIQGTYPFSTTV